MSENTNRTTNKPYQKFIYDYETDSYIPVAPYKPTSQPQTKQTPLRTIPQATNRTSAQHKPHQSKTGLQISDVKKPLTGIRHNTSKPQHPQDTQFVKRKNSKACKKTNKRGLAIVALALSGVIAASSLIGVANQKPESTLHNSHETNYATSENTEVVQNASKITSLDQISPKFEFITWKGEKHLTIDEESFKQIIELAMNDVRDFYVDELGAPNMQFQYDESKHNIVNVQGKENFYEKGYSWEHIAGMAQQESSSDLMVDFVNDIGYGSDNPAGILQIMPETTKKTLSEYFKNIFGADIDLSDYEPLPTKEEVNAILSSNPNDRKKAEKEITDAVYDSVFLTVASEAYFSKSFTKGHQNCYTPYFENYTPEKLINEFNIDPSQHDEVYQIFQELKEYNGIYSPTLTRSALTAMHLYGFGDVRTSLKDGSFFKKYFNSTYVKNILNNEDQIQANGFGPQP